MVKEFWKLSQNIQMSDKAARERADDDDTGWKKSRVHSTNSGPDQNDKSFEQLEPRVGPRHIPRENREMMHCSSSGTDAERT